MNKKRPLLNKAYLLIISLLYCTFSINSQTNLIVEYKDFSQEIFSVTSNDLLYFDDENMYISNEATPATIPLGSIKKVYFETSLSTGNNITENDNEISIYPNPCRNVINIHHNLSTEITIEIYTLSGILLLRDEFANKQIDIGTLSPGIYLLKVNNKVLKFCKI
jgi:hypothetical protein